MIIWYWRGSGRGIQYTRSNLGYRVGVAYSHQPSLLDLAPVAKLGQLSHGLTRTELTDGAWVDHRPGWVCGSDQLLEILLTKVPWESERRQMYDRVLAVPRLLFWYSAGATLPDQLLTDARAALSEHYAGELGEPFATAGMCLYRNGHDSVAWHGDTIGRGAHTDTLVAIISIGSARSLQLRPRGGGPGVKFALGHGDLVVMGGSCQRTWEHAVPKTTRAVGPRVSIQFRPVGVR